MVYQIVWIWALLEWMATTLMLPFLQLLSLNLSPKSIVTWNILIASSKLTTSQCRQNRVFGYELEAETTVLKWLHNEYSYRRCPNKPKQSKQISRAIINENLSLKVHIHEISKKVSSGIGALSMHTAIKLYKGLIEPQFDYCSALWDGFIQQLSEKLLKL